MITSSGQYVVKLSKARVEALAATNAGERFDGNRGRPMKEWLVVRLESAEEWLEFACDALEFVGG